MTEARNVTVCVLLVDNDRILLIKNPEEIKTIPGKKPFKKESKWGMPRGRKEPEDKDDIATCDREGREETGYEIEVDSRYRVQESVDDHNMIAFVGYPVAGRLEPDPKEIIEARWFSPRVLWAESGDKDHLDMHPRQRRMAQALWRNFKNGGRR